MKGRKDGWRDGWQEEGIDEREEGWMDERGEGWREGWEKGRMDGWMDKWHGWWFLLKCKVNLISPFNNLKLTFLKHRLNQ